jgi:hypothetical protein
VPQGVTVRKVDLGQELQILAYHEHRKTEELSKTDHATAGEPGMIGSREHDRARVTPSAGDLVHSEGKDV